MNVFSNLLSKFPQVYQSALMSQCELAQHSAGGTGRDWTAAVRFLRPALPGCEMRAPTS